MKRNNFALLLTASLLSLAGCGETVDSSSNKTDSASSNTTDSVSNDADTSSIDSGEVTVEFWHTMGKANQDILKGMIKSFESENPGIKIKESAAAGGYDDLEEAILKASSTGGLPTMAFCYPDHVAEYLDRGTSGIVTDLTQFINDPELAFTKEDGSHKDEDDNDVYGVDDFVPTFWDEGCNYTKEGVYSVPFAKSTEALFYNKDYFDTYNWEIPQTWDQMWTLCREIAEMKLPGVVAPLGYDSDSNLFISLSKQMNIPFTSATGEEHYLFNNPQAKAMVSDLKSKFDEGLFITKGSNGNNTYTSSKFTAGEVIMTIGSTGGTTYNQTANFEVGVAEPPAYDLANKAVISQGPSICFFNAASSKMASPAQLKAAWKFYKFISNAENSTLYSVSTGYQPVRTSSYQTETYKKFASDTTSLLNSVANVSSGMLDSYFNSPVFVGSAKARNEVGSLLSAVLMGSKTVDAAFETAISNCVNG